MLRPLFSVFFILLSSILLAQMPAPDGAVSYGNEWINYDRDYLRVSVAEDGMYRISPAQISAGLGAALSPENASKWELSHQGQAIPIEVTTEGIVFYGEQNRGAMDRFLFEDPATMQLNDRYSMYNDTAVYYLSLAPETGGPFYQVPSVNPAPPAVTQILRKSEVVFGDFQSKFYLRFGTNSVYHSHYEPTEGYGSRSSDDLLSNNGSTESLAELRIPGFSGAAATVSFRFGLAFDAHQQKICLNGQELTTVSPNRWTVNQLDFPFTPDQEQVSVSFLGESGVRDKANLAWVLVDYPAVPTYDDDLTSFRLQDNNASSLTLTDLGAGAGAVKVYDPSNGQLISAPRNGTSTTLAFPAVASAPEYHLVADSENYKTASTAPLRFTSALPEDTRTNYLILTSRRLRGPGIEQIVDYRRSAAGGSYRVHVVDVEDLYEEFGYGIARHPMSVRNYLSRAKEVAPALQYLFLIGKGREYTDLRTGEQLQAAEATYFIPSFGLPASDNLLSAPVGSVIPTLSTGRLSAINNEEIAIYAKKLSDVEAQVNLGNQTLEDRQWMKEILHLGGGVSAGEQTSIRRNLGIMGNTAQNNTFGAGITAFFKTSSEPIEESRQDAIFERINNGTAIITFFGHSSSQGFDFSIDDPENYFNTNKYPYMLSLGCYSGDAFNSQRSISERFIFLRDKGAVAFAATKGIGFLSSLGNWADNLYALMGDEYYGQGIGDALRANIADFEDFSLYTYTTLVEQFSLSGDPAYRMHPQPGPDLVFDPTSVSFEPLVVPVQDQEFTINLDVVNLGQFAGADSITLRFRQQLPSGETIDLRDYRMATPPNRTSISVNLPNPGLPAVGQNRIFVTADIDQELNERPSPQAESNNELMVQGRTGVPLTFIANTARAAFPPNYGVTGGPLELVASTTNTLAPERDYIFQVSLRKDFRDILASERISSPGSVIRYRPAISPADSTTYYWRISPDTTFTEGAGFIWSESSFTWLADRTVDQIGWAMADPGQTIAGEFVNILGDSLEENWNFRQTVTDFKITNAVFRDALMPRYEWNGLTYRTQFPWHTRSGLQLTVIDSIDNERWDFNPGGGLYGTTPRSSGDVFSFDTRTPTGRKALMDFIENEIDLGKYVALYSAQRGSSIEYVNDGWLEDESTYGQTLFDVLEREGALEIRDLATLGSVPYNFVFQKGIGRVTEDVAASQTDTIVTLATIRKNWPEGTWRSESIGPATQWNSISTRFDAGAVSASDSCRLLISGAATQRGERTLIEESVLPISATLASTLDISAISPMTYPFLWVELQLFDAAERTVPTLRHLYVDFAGIGDVTINPNLEYAAQDSLQRGEVYRFTTGYENLSAQPMDSVLFEFQAIDVANNTTTLYQRKAPLEGRGRGTVSFELPTDNSTSDLRIQVTANPNNDQPEEILYNNVLTTGVGTKGDPIAPDAKLFFDGQEIRDRDLVSSEPEILLRLRDNDPQLLLNDTIGMNIELEYPSGNRERIYLGDERIEFIPATSTDNEARVFFRPTLTENGLYKINIEAQDRSGNAAGRLALQQEFEVITEQQVANVLTYPNPFSTQTHFVYTLTGNQLPEIFRIQIMTVSGRVVRDIDLLAVENLKIGTHRTNFTWDGTDEYGDMLANGVYLYRVITRNNEGGELDQYDNGTDQFFANKLGKVVILR